MAKKKETLYEKEIYGSCPVHIASDRKYGGMREGRCTWEAPVSTMNGISMQIVEVVTKAAQKEYLAYLRDMGISAGDIQFTMYASIFATVVCRVIFSIVFGVWMNLGVIGICLAMVGDWLVKAALIMVRYRSRKWTKFQVIG